MRRLDDPLSERRCEWRTASVYRLSTDREIHVWRRSLDCTSVMADKLNQLLSADERLRAQRFHFDRDRRRFIVRRAALRIILSSYLRAEPRELRFESGPQGKPRLAGEFAGKALEFSMTHSQGMALLAVGAGQRIGIDLECVRPLPDLDRLLSLCLSPAEISGLDAADLLDPLDRFYRYWTCKEACLKAIGIGLSRPLDSVRISLPAADATGTAEVCCGSDETTGLFVRSFSPFTGYGAAAAFLHHQSRLRCFAF